MSFPKFLSVGIVLTALSSIANAHELWIDPTGYQVPSGAPIQADIRVGEDFEGSAFSFLPDSFRRFELVQGDKAADVVGRLGDRPALNQTAEDGLVVVVYESDNSRLTYQSFEKFEAFVRHKDALWTVEQHRTRGLPEETFVEVYSRYAKSLVAEGSGAGSDREVGLLTELVALANPYTDDLDGTFPIQVLYKGKGRAGAQVEIFEKSADGTVNVTTAKADDRGVARIPVKPGHAYQLDAVVLRAPSPELSDETGAVWESLWANLTFFVPEQG